MMDEILKNLNTRIENSKKHGHFKDVAGSIDQYEVYDLEIKMAQAVMQNNIIVLLNRIAVALERSPIIVTGGGGDKDKKKLTSKNLKPVKETSPTPTDTLGTLEDIDKL